ncbi:RNA polymerase subunit sigma-24 [Streptomyces sp. NRRL B-1140]|uniref:sigma-70 family RNA polymerase sigma factor n=1 Tax=Streptomyces sp. NRRL B-1140 TaxID=1415549 RepID=UPI0006ADD153|nr:sigma-70 family RNA polymerase sigma factor [Streptomyces sp. NRRL B-1140]KOV96892.1 RNA polymerase subunit sigma-24 [Streptomyces sp. NRRL B-1140]
MTQFSAHRTGSPLDAATGMFVEHRELLFGVVYNILGGVADTEDVLQETWLSWTARGGGAPLAGVDNPRAYLVRVAVNHALRRRAVISRRQETYVGPWLPEPLVAPEESETAETPALRSESVSLAMLVVLESLTPLERAVFVLGEVFGYPHAEIAEIIDRSPAAVRQLAHRAREHVHARRPRYEAHPRVRREATERFVRAALGGDIAELMEVLAPDVTAWTDAGGKRRRAGLRPVHGREKVARLLTAGRGGPDRPVWHYRRVNGDDAAVLFDGDAPFAVLVLDLTPQGDRVRGIYVVANPDKLAHLPRAAE